MSVVWVYSISLVIVRWKECCAGGARGRGILLRRSASEKWSLLKGRIMPRICSYARHGTALWHRLEQTRSRHSPKGAAAVPIGLPLSSSLSSAHSTWWATRAWSGDILQERRRDIALFEVKIWFSTPSFMLGGRPMFRYGLVRLIAKTICRCRCFTLVLSS